MMRSVYTGQCFRCKQLWLLQTAPARRSSSSLWVVWLPNAPLRANANPSSTRVLDEYTKSFGESWRSAQADSTQAWPYLNEALTKFQDPAEADKLLKIERELDETKIIHHKTIEVSFQEGRG